MFCTAQIMNITYSSSNLNELVTNYNLYSVQRADWLICGGHIPKGRYRNRTLGWEHLKGNWLLVLSNLSDRFRVLKQPDGPRDLNAVRVSLAAN